MIGNRSLFWGCVFVFFPAVIFANDDILARQLELERRAIDHRLQIKSAMLKLTVQIATREKDKPADLDARRGTSRVEKWTIYIDGDRRRVDHFAPHVPSYGPDGRLMVPEQKQFESRVVLTPDKYIYFEPTTFKDYGWPPAARTGPRSESMPFEKGTFKFEMLGMIPMPAALLRRTGVESFWGIKNRSESEIENSTVNGVNMVVASFRRNDGHRVALSFGNESGDRVVSTEFACQKKDGTRQVQRMRSDLKEYEGGIWFPKSVEYTSHDGDKLVENELWTVDEAQFNVEIDPKVFTIEGLQVSPGTIVIDHTSTAVKPILKDWDGRELKIRAAPSLPLAKAPAKQPRSSAFQFLVTANICIGSVLMWLSSRKRKNAEEINTA